MSYDSLGVAAVNWVYIAEIFNPATKPFGISSSVALIWLLNYAISKSTPLAILQIGYGWWVLLGVLNCLFVSLRDHSPMPYLRVSYL